jgi:hypothetical protein
VGLGGYWLPGPFCVSRSLAEFENRDARQLGKHQSRFTKTDKERGQSSRGSEAEDERLTAGGLIPTAESLKSIDKQFVWQSD